LPPRGGREAGGVGAREGAGIGAGAGADADVSEGPPNHEGK